MMRKRSSIVLHTGGGIQNPSIVRPCGPVAATTVARRYNSGDDKNDKKSDNDPFGVDYKDGDERLGPESELPPRYVRDPVSGKLTGETETEEHPDDMATALSNLSEDDQAALLSERLTQHWADSTNTDKEEEVARLIRRQRMALNTLGRKTSDVAATADKDGVAAPLSASEFAAFRQYAATHPQGDAANSLLDQDDFPMITSPVMPADDRGFDPDQDLSWVKDANNNVDGGGDHWTEDILPSDLAPARRVNRREAQPVPKSLLHHNNLSLLRRYVTPGGQILNRVQSRLGAKDQRKVARLIKRSRALGIMPTVGQWKYEDHGDLFAPDVHEDRDWEQELQRRGLVIERKKGSE